MIFSIIKRSIQEQLRSPVVIILSLITAPLFVMLYAVFFPAETQSYDIMFLNKDSETADLFDYMTRWSPNDEAPILNLQKVGSKDEGIKRIKDGNGELLLIIPESFSDSLLDVQSGRKKQAIPFELIGDLSDQTYSVAVIMAYSAIESYVSETTGITPPLTLTEEPLGMSGKLNELDYYIPGLLIFSLIILIFQISMNLSRLVECGLLKRLRLTNATAFKILTGYSASIIIFGIAAFYLTLGAAFLFGSTLSGNWILTGLTVLLTALAITGAGMIVSAFSPTVSGAFIVANFPLMLFMFFSGAMFPMKKVEIFTIGEKVVGLFDFLPTTHAVNALHEILVMKGGIKDILYEIVLLLLLTAMYIILGVRLYYKRHMKID